MSYEHRRIWPGAWPQVVGHEVVPPDRAGLLVRSGGVEHESSLGSPATTSKGRHLFGPAARRVGAAPMSPLERAGRLRRPSLAVAVSSGCRYTSSSQRLRTRIFTQDWEAHRRNRALLRQRPSTALALIVDVSDVLFQAPPMVVAPTMVSPCPPPPSPFDAALDGGEISAPTTPDGARPCPTASAGAPAAARSRCSRSPCRGRPRARRPPRPTLPSSPTRSLYLAGDGDIHN